MPISFTVLETRTFEATGAASKIKNERKERMARLFVSSTVGGDGFRSKFLVESATLETNRPFEGKNSLNKAVRKMNYNSL